MWTTRYLRAATVADGACALAAGFLALVSRFDGRPHFPAFYLAATFALPVLWVGWLALAGGYDPRFIGVGSDEFHHLLNAAIALTATAAIVSYAVKFDLARGYVVIALPATAVFDLAARFTLRKWLHWHRQHGRCMRRVAVVGHRGTVAQVIACFRRERQHGLQVVAACLPQQATDREVEGVPVRGEFSNVPQVVRACAADTVAVLACPELSGLALRRLAWSLEKTRTDLLIAPALLDVAGPRTTIRPVAGLPLLHLEHAELTGAKWVLKGLFDKVAAAVALFLLSPALVVIALQIKLADGGPVLFSQTRVGKDGRLFTMYKFRSMVVDAEKKWRKLAIHNEQDGPLFKIRGDPRITRPGAWLRRWSLDELPQLVNVLIGDMSLVGPRPPLPSEADTYGSYVRRKLAVKPGMTGLWQINGRSDLCWDDAVRFDVRYVENWSLTLDLQILWKTCATVVGGRGAY